MARNRLADVVSHSYSLETQGTNYNRTVITGEHRRYISTEREADTI
jgi:hypothetical protein